MKRRESKEKKEIKNMDQKEAAALGGNYTYMVKCRDGTIYTGWTTALERRISEHNSGKGAKYTRSRRPVELVYYEESRSKQEAMRRESEIKKMTREQKLELIKKNKKSD